MKSLGPQFLLLLLVTVAAVALACGTSPHVQSVSITPAAANAKDYPEGQVQFRAFAYYPGSSSPAAITPEWSACPPVNVVTVSKTGVAQCVPGAAGTYYVEAFVPVGELACSPTGPSNPLQSCPLPTGQQCGGVEGTATLTCP
jgi:hypothetical protein